MNKPNSPTKRRLIRVAPGGIVEFVYDDALAGLLQAGQSDVTRASHVEPETTPNGIHWVADLAPVHGPALGPFATRTEALTAEVEWLNAHHLRRNAHALP